MISPLPHLDHRRLAGAVLADTGHARAHRGPDRHVHDGRDRVAWVGEGDAVHLEQHLAAGLDA